jgi:hypothetical protein
MMSRSFLVECFSGQGEEMGKGMGNGKKTWEMVNIVQILYIHVCKWKKMIHVETVLGIEVEVKKNGEGVNSSMIYFI